MATHFELKYKRMHPEAHEVRAYNTPESYEAFLVRTRADGYKLAIQFEQEEQPYIYYAVIGL